MTNHFSIALFMSLSILASFSCIADDKDFFPKNYVQDDSINHHDDTANDPMAPQHSGTPVAAESIDAEFKEMGQDPSTAPTSSATPSSVDLREGIKTEAISLIVDGLLYDDMKKYIRLADEFSLAHNIPIKNIFLINSKYVAPDYKTDLYGLLMSAMARGGTFSHEEEVPPKYAAIKLSPTWIIHTVKGEIMLEGIDELNSLFNSEDLFLGPQM